MLKTTASQIPEFYDFLGAFLEQVGLDKKWGEMVCPGGSGRQDSRIRGSAADRPFSRLEFIFCSFFSLFSSSTELFVQGPLSDTLDQGSGEFPLRDHKGLGQIGSLFPRAGSALM